MAEAIPGDVFSWVIDIHISSIPFISYVIGSLISILYLMPLDSNFLVLNTEDLFRDQYQSKEVSLCEFYWKEANQNLFVDLHTWPNKQK